MPWALEMMAAFTPMARPSRSTSGPPELPIFTPASVWMSPRISWTGSVGSALAEIERERPETMPRETVFLKMPKAFPMAMTVWPSSSFRASPMGTAGKLRSGMRRMATSLMGSRLTTSAGSFAPPSRMTVYAAFESVTTCLFVSISPGATLKPEPPPIETMPWSSMSDSGILNLRGFLMAR